MNVDEFITYCGVAGTINKHAAIGRQWSSNNGARDQYVFECQINYCDFWIQYYVVADTGEKVFMNGRVAHDHSVFGSMSFEVWGIDSLMLEIEAGS